MISDWMKVMLEEISRKKSEAEQARLEEQLRREPQPHREAQPKM
jgi:hypothetical protein